MTAAECVVMLNLDAVLGGSLLGPNSSIFMQFLTKILLNNVFAPNSGVGAPPVWEILDLPLRMS